MKRLLMGAALLSLFGLLSWALDRSKTDATPSLDRYLSRLPTDLQLKEEGPQKYLFTCDYFYLDPLGNLTRKERVSAQYTRALPDGKVRWSHVRIAQAKGFDDPFPEGESQKYTEDFAYRLSSSKDMLKKEFFQGFPPAEMKTKNLVWDTHMIEDFGRGHFDKLELNRAYSPQSGPEDVPLAGAGTFQNRRVELTWVGISKRNEKICALIQYQAFFNKLNVSNPATNFQGRSHYWGEIWVSLTDKQIEYATLYEDVLLEFSAPGQSSKQLVNPFRKGTFQRLWAAKAN